MGAPSCRKMVARPKIRSSLAIMWICWRRMWIQPNHRDSAIKTWVSRLVNGQFWELAFLAILLGIVTTIIYIYIYYIYTHTYMIPNFGGDTLRYNDTQLQSNVVWSFCRSVVRLSTHCGSQPLPTGFLVKMFFSQYPFTLIISHWKIPGTHWMCAEKWMIFVVII